MSNDQNPFLISAPPPGNQPLPDAAADHPDALGNTDVPEEPIVDTATFITLPPGIVDPGTVRVSGVRTTRAPTPAVEPGDIVFFPVVPGIPVARIVADPAVAASDGGGGASSGIDADKNRLAPPRHAPVRASWRIILPRSGQIVPLAGALYLGRNPARTADRQDAELLAVDDPATSLSKTHALLEVADDVLWVHDLNSTNGVYVVHPDASVIEVQPGQRVAVPPGAEVEFGEYVVRVERD